MRQCMDRSINVLAVTSLILSLSMMCGCKRVRACAPQQQQKPVCVREFCSPFIILIDVTKSWIG